MVSLGRKVKALSSPTGWIYSQLPPQTIKLDLGFSQEKEKGPPWQEGMGGVPKAASLTDLDLEVRKL